jgi:hypothetical protein
MYFLIKEKFQRFTVLELTRRAFFTDNLRFVEHDEQRQKQDELPQAILSIVFVAIVSTNNNAATLHGSIRSLSDKIEQEEKGRVLQGATGEAT